MSRLRHLLLAVVAVTLYASNSHACVTWETGAPLRNPSGGIQHDIGVYLHVPESNNGTFLGWPLDRMEQSIRYAIDLWLEESHADLRPYYAGRTNKKDNRYRIVIREGTSFWCGEDVVGCTVPNRGWGPGGPRMVGATIHMQQSEQHEPHIWGSIIAHELGHAFGLADLYDTFNGRNCNWDYGQANLMGLRPLLWASGGNLGRDDQKTMLDLYKVARRPVAYVESTDAQTFVAGSPPDSLEGLSLESRVSSSANRGALDQYVEANGNGGAVLVTGVGVSSATGEARVPLGFPPAAWHPAALADASSQRWLIAFTTGEIASSPTRNIGLFHTRDHGATYSDGPLLFNDFPIMTRLGGVSATHDPKSNFYVVGHRDARNWTQSVPHLTAVGGQEADRSFDRATLAMLCLSIPVVECAETGEFNCLAVCTSSYPMYPLAWAQFRIGRGGLFQFQGSFVVDFSLTTSTYSTPALTATDDENAPFVVAIKQLDGVVAYRFSAATQSWQFPGSLAVSTPREAPVTSPTLALVHKTTVIGGVSSKGASLPGADLIEREIHLRFGMPTVRF